jgi:hypothetical protein
MFRHVVMFRWNDTVDDDDLAAVGAGLDALAAEIAEIAAFAHGPDVGVNDGNYDYVVVGDFRSLDDYNVYRDHPAHRRFITDLIAGRVAERSAVQYEFAD